MKVLVLYVVIVAIGGFIAYEIGLFVERQNEVRSLRVTCAICHHAAIVDVDAFADDVPVPSYGAFGGGCVYRKFDSA